MNEWEWQLLEDKTTIDHVETRGIKIGAGSRVRLHPRAGGDVMDLALAGQIAIIESIEQDYEGKHHICVVLEDDPGKDMGLLRQPGHRFFFDLDEIVPLSPDEFPSIAPRQRPTILVAGIGNIFLGDDGFGVEVARRLSTRPLPAAVRVVDFGIRAFDLIYALQDGYETTILVDACPRNQPPGTLFVIQPDLKDLNDVDLESSPPTMEAHAMNPMTVLRMARAMNINVNNLLLVGCEPATFGGEEGQLGLSPEVEAAVDDAVKLVESWIDKILNSNHQVPT